MVQLPARTVVRFFLVTAGYTPALGPTQLPIHWVPGILSPGIKCPGRKVDHSPPSGSEFKNAWSYTSTPLIRLHGTVRS
jgi:hypothetical protein